MKRLKINAALVLCAGLLLASSPALAWTCTAKNAGGTKFVSIGILRVNAETRAIAKCKLASGLPTSCVIVDCKP
jgi:hypothetical protein